ncbi:hypothetical protein [Bacillus sp. UNC438CL73TsuS30]|uniref:hypothetical protein n=1 Tax=Bacillus sp. UNC438CL73TsuS30 TaxID=1340434 RepID=UPI00068A1D53|nr:hypothetical protein [Bacillus sp. UNC438CL73TsuS30]
MQKIDAEELVSIILGPIILAGIVWGIHTAYQNYVEENERNFDNDIVECNPNENPDCIEEAPLDASDIYGPGEEPVNGNPGYHSVEGYYRSDGTHVNGYIRSNPDGNPNNNLGGK